MKSKSVLDKFLRVGIATVLAGSFAAACASGDDGVFPAERPFGAGGVGGSGGLINNPGTSGCGDGVVSGTESCDSNNLAGETCASVTMNANPSGALACTAACTFDTTGCLPATGTGGGPTVDSGTCNQAFCPSTFGTPCCMTANGPCGCDMGMGCMDCTTGGG